MLGSRVNPTIFSCSLRNKRGFKSPVLLYEGKTMSENRETTGSGRATGGRENANVLTIGDLIPKTGRGQALYEALLEEGRRAAHRLPKEEAVEADLIARIRERGEMLYYLSEKRDNFARILPMPHQEAAFKDAIADLDERIKDERIRLQKDTEYVHLKAELKASRDRLARLRATVRNAPAEQ